MSDASEEIDSIIWNVYGKIERVVRTTASAKSDLEFHYDAMGNRVLKIVKPRTAGVGIQSQDNWTYTYYERDASGNVIAVYTRDYTTPAAGKFKDIYGLSENHLYGSSRVGIRTVTQVQISTTYTYVSTGSDGILNGTFFSRASNVASTTSFTHLMGKKAYELSNHLGNVLVTVSDARTANNSAGTVVSFNAVVINAQDYYAFGSSMPGRNSNSSAYRFSFNGKEKDAETDLQDYGMRIYNEQLGRFLSVDHSCREYPWNSTYSFAENDVIRCVDVDGAEKYVVVRWYDQTTGEYTGSTIFKIQNSGDRPFGEEGILYLNLNNTDANQTLVSRMMQSSQIIPSAYDNFTKLVMDPANGIVDASGQLVPSVAFKRDAVSATQYSKNKAENDAFNDIESRMKVTSTTTRDQMNISVYERLGVVNGDIQFNYNSAAYDPNISINRGYSNQTILGNLEQTLMDNPDLVVDLEGHTSTEGDDVYNQDLSQRRVSTMRQTLIDAGIAPERINIKSSGESKPKSSQPQQNSASNPSVNRRVTITLKMPKQNQ